MTNTLVNSSGASYDIDSAISGSESQSQIQALLPHNHQHAPADAAHRPSDARSVGLNSGLGGGHHSIVSPTAAVLPPLRKPSVSGNSITNKFSSVKVG